MNIRDYRKYFDTTANELSSDELKHLVTYFCLLGKVEKPVVSLVIPVYRAKETLLAHIVSLSKITTIIPYEVIFIDNNADDVTLSILNQLGANVIKETKQGITHARQKGLECAKGEIICTMDPDTLYGPSYLDRMVLPFFKDKDLVLCYSISKSYKDNFLMDFKTHLRNWIKAPYLRWKFLQRFEIRIKYVRAYTMAMRKSALSTIGYPTDLKSVAGCDDGLIAVQLNNLGKHKYIPTTLFTALPPPREAWKPFPFCNEKFYTFLLMVLLFGKISFAQSANTSIDNGIYKNEILGDLSIIEEQTVNPHGSILTNRKLRFLPIKIENNSAITKSATLKPFVEDFLSFAVGLTPLN